MKLVKLPDFPHISIPVSEKVGVELEEENNLFISVGEYPVYDKDSYDFMEKDDNVSIAYEETLDGIVDNKKVLDIGTGAYMDWALLSVELGASKAVGVEAMESTYKLAKENLEKFKYKKYVELHNCLSTKFETEEKFDVCVSEIIGCIGGSEGAEVSINDAKKRLLKEGAKIVPYSCQTYVAGVCLEELVDNIQFHPSAVGYINNIFLHNGSPFDLRLALTHPPKNHNLFHTDEMLVEDLQFETGNSKTDFERFIKINKNCKIDGLLLWIDLVVDNYSRSINSLNDSTAWEVLYIPMFDIPKKYNEGDTLKLKCEKYLDKDGVHPNYKFSLSDSTCESTFDSKYSNDKLYTKSIYRKLFGNQDSSN